MSANQQPVLVVAILALAVFCPAVSAEDDTQMFNVKTNYKKIVGTYYGEDHRVVTYHSDGTLTLIDANMFSDDNSNDSLGRKTTPYLGVWHKVGKNSIQATSLTFATEQFGHNYLPDGLAYKISWLAVFDEAVDGVYPGYTYENLTVEIFRPEQNPTVDEPVAVVTAPPKRSYRLTFDQAPQ